MSANNNVQERVVRLMCLFSLSMALAFSTGCAKGGLRCDEHLTPINAPQPPAAAIDVKPAIPGAP